MKKIISFFSGIGEMLSILWRSSKALTLLLVFNNLIRNALWPLRAFIVKQIVEIIVLSSEDGFLIYKNTLFSYIIIFFFLFWCNRIWWPLNSYTQTLILAKVSNKARQRIIKVMERVPLAFFDYSENYDTYTRALAQTDDRQPINAINRVINFISLIISFVTAFTIMISINFPVTVILLLSSIPSVLWEEKFNQKIYKYDQEATNKKRLLEYLFLLFTNKTSAKEIRLFKTGSYLYNKHENVLKEYDRKYIELVSSKIKYDSLFWFILQAALMVGYFIIISEVNTNKIDIGSLSFFLTIATSLQEAIKNVGSSFNGVIQSNRYFDSLLRFEKLNNELDSTINYIDVPETIESIEFKNVSFLYPNSDQEILKDVSFILRSPQNVVLAGENGAGKTTLLKLLMGFYKPSSGEILINGHDIRRYRQEEYYRLFSVCFQDYMKYGFSFKDNIIMANRKVDDTFFNQIIRDTQLGDVLERLPNKEETYLSREFDENGIELSGGEYNRIAIARAMAKDAQIVLFDEPNAALDAKAEQNLFQLYEMLTKNKIGIMITHRLSAAVNADLILLLKDGKLIEYGNHSELLKKNGEYANLFHLQGSHYIFNEEGIKVEKYN